jgi:hypothetical protein
LDSISLIGAEALSASSLGYNQSFGAQQTASLALQVNHRFTARLHTVVSATYADNSFTAPLLNQQFQLRTTTPNDEAITAQWTIGYDFRIWLSAGMYYNYTKLLSSDVNLVQSYSRDQIGVSLTLTY